MSSDSDPGILKGLTESGERVAIPAPRPKQHWSTTIPVVTALAVAFASGVMVMTVNALKDASAEQQRQTRESLKEMGNDLKNYAQSNDARVRAIEDWRIRHESEIKRSK